MLVGRKDILLRLDGGMVAMVDKEVDLQEVARDLSLDRTKLIREYIMEGLKRHALERGEEIPEAVVVRFLTDPVKASNRPPRRRQQVLATGGASGDGDVKAAAPALQAHDVGDDGEDADAGVAAETEGQATIAGTANNPIVTIPEGTAERGGGREWIGSNIRRVGGAR